MTLSQMLLSQFHNELLRIERRYFKDIYQIKTVHSRLGDSILFSCRFKTQKSGTLLLSIRISLKRPEPQIRTSIHQFCTRKIFSKTVYQKRVALPMEESLAGIMEQSKYNNYYQVNRQLPYCIMVNIFNKYCKESLTKTIDIIEEFDHVID